MKNLNVSKKKGFSLVELLVVIAVIGVIAAIAIPAMTNIFGSSRTAKARRNAQNLASAYSAALAAGADASDDMEDAIEDLGTGMTGKGQFSTSVFKVALDADEATAAQTHLEWDTTGKTIVYTGTTGDASNDAP